MDLSKQRWRFMEIQGVSLREEGVDLSAYMIVCSRVALSPSARREWI